MFRKPFNKKNLGFSAIELIVSIGIFSLISAAATWLVIRGLRDNSVIWEQLAAQSDGRNILRQTSDDMRRAQNSSIGSYPIVLADDNEFIFYANVDKDALIERVRFWLQDSTLKKGVIKPSGSPLGYDLDSESSTEVAHEVVNQAENKPVFMYFDETYSGSEDPLETPAVPIQVRMVKIQLELEKNPAKSPAPFHVESTVQIRNLKSN
ncbi:MAG: type II secretion system protein [Candidatus Magasanikbacteria bacterium]|nr:type II secretion system protein [Candidatus Magasanikbacteria bacterium]